MAPWSRMRPSLLIPSVCLLFAAVSQAATVKPAPALYTGDFGDCLGGSSPFTITVFDAIYDASNKTVVLHLNGTSTVEHEAVTLHLTIDAYGENRLDLSFDPCSYPNMTSLCLSNASVPIAALAVLPIGSQSIGQLSNTISRAPDFEGSARLQILANSSGTEIGCFQAVMTNGRTLSQPAIIAPVLFVFTLAAILASFLTAAYGVSIPHMRMHHAHSLPVLVVLETFQAIFFSGALSVQWPAVLPAWWSNFSWSAGLIYNSAMFQAVDAFAGAATSNASQIGNGILASRQISVRAAAHKSAAPVYNSTYFKDYSWSGAPVAPGLPLPGTWSGFPGVLSPVGVPIVSAFMVALIWLLIAVGLVILTAVGFKISLEGLLRAKHIKEDCLAYFRSHWTGYLGHALLRTLVIACFPIMTLTMLQFTIRLTVGTVAVAAVVFILVFIGMASLVASACRARTQGGKFVVDSNKVVFYRTTMLRVLPRIEAAWDSTLKEYGLGVKVLFSVPLFRIRHINNDAARDTVHQDEAFIKRFGWFSARYRRMRWWFLAYYVGYLFCRAAFLGGGWQNPSAQVYGVLVVDVLNLGISIVLGPFEGTRNATIAVWLLGVCKVITTAVSIAFLPEFNTDRQTAAGLGVFIIVIQGLTVIALLILIVLSGYSTWLSLMRNRAEMDPDWLEPARVRYFTKMEKKARDARFEDEASERQPTPYFSVVTVRRNPKIEDEDAGHEAVQTDSDADADDNTSTDPDLLTGHARDNHSRSHSRASSIANSRLSTGSLPRAARPYRASWSSRDFRDRDRDRDRDSVVTQRLSGVTCVVVTDCDAASTTTTNMSSSTAALVGGGGGVRPQSSLWSLNTPSASASASRASSPSTPRRSREIVVVAEGGRRPPTALAEAPEPQEEV